jgi:uncharacterized repeat protein (TIGR01451 family)
MNRFSRTLVSSVAAAALFSAFPTASQAAVGDLYAVTGAGNDGFECGGTLSSLYSLDPTDGSASLIGPVTIEGTQIRHVTALAMHPSTGVLYAIANDLEDSDGCNDAVLMTVDTATGVATVVPTADPLPANIPDMTFDPFGNLYAWSEYNDFMIVIDVTDGSWDYVPDANVNTWQTGLASDSNGRLYIKLAEYLYRLNQYTGVAFDEVFLDRQGDNILAFNEADVMFSGKRSNSGFTLFTINPETGVTTTIGSNSVMQISALTFDLGVVTPPDIVNLSISKSADTLEPRIGDDIVFTLTLTNHDLDDAADNVVVRDVLPSNFSYVSSTGDGTYDDTTGEWTVASILADTNAVIEITATATSGGAFVNSAEIMDSDSYDPNSVPGSGDTEADGYDEVSGSVHVPTLFSISRRDDLLWVVDPALSQTEVAQEMTVGSDSVCGGNGLTTQPGTDTLFGVVSSGDCSSRALVTIDSVSAEATEIGDFGNTRIAAIAFGEDANTLYATSGNSGDLTQTLFTVDPTDASLTQECVLPPSQYGRALAYGDGSIFDATYDCGNSCQLIIRQIDPASFPTDPSDPCVVTTTIETGIFSEPTAMTIREVGPDYITFLVVSYSSLYEVTIPGDVDPADVTFLGYLQHQSKGLAFAFADPTVADLSVTKSAVKNRVKGDKFIEYTLYAQNNGPESVDNVELTDAIPFGTTLVSTSGGCSESGGVVTCDAGTLDSGEAQNFTMVVQVTCKKCSSVSNSVSIDADADYYEYPYNNSWQINTSVKGKF